MKTKIFLLVMVLSFVANAARVDMHVDSGATGTLVQGQAGWGPATSPESCEVYLETLIANTDTVNIWIRGGDTIKPGSDWNWTARDMTSGAPLIICGVSPGCTKVGADIDSATNYALHPDSQPFFLCGSYNIRPSDYNHLRFISATSSATRTIVGPDAALTIEGCNIYSTATGTTSFAYYGIAANAKIIGCNIISACNGIGTAGAAALFYKDSINAAYGGIVVTANQQFIFSCLIRGGIRGVIKTTNYNVNVLNTTIYDCDSGIVLGGGYQDLYADNLIDSSSAVGIYQSALSRTHLFVANHVDPTRNNNNAFSGMPATGNYGDILRTDGNPLFGAGLKPALNSPVTDHGIHIGGMYK